MIPRSNRVVASKPFYVFFALNGKYSDCYTIIRARNFEQARQLAINQYGVWDVGKISNNKEWSENKIKACGLTKI